MNHSYCPNINCGIILHPGITKCPSCNSKPAAPPAANPAASINKTRAETVAETVAKPNVIAPRARTPAQPRHSAPRPARSGGRPSAPRARTPAQP
eukprot:4532775-Prymnesium_polylepis.1